MKKLLFSLTALLINTSISYAYMEASNMTNIDAVRKQGFSESTVRVLDTTKSHHQGDDSRYTRRFKLKTSPYYYLRSYVDPGADDGKFGEHQINFSNSWSGDFTRYDSPLKETGTVENL